MRYFNVAIVAALAIALMAATQRSGEFTVVSKRDATGNDPLGRPATSTTDAQLTARLAAIERRLDAGTRRIALFEMPRDPTTRRGIAGRSLLSRGGNIRGVTASGELGFNLPPGHYLVNVLYANTRTGSYPELWDGKTATKMMNWGRTDARTHGVTVSAMVSPTTSTIYQFRTFNTRLRVWTVAPVTDHYQVQIEIEQLAVDATSTNSTDDNSTE